jgi:hypothetical protein
MSGFERLDRFVASTAREAVRRKASGMAITDKDRKFIIEPHFAGRKSLL